MEESGPMDSPVLIGLMGSGKSSIGRRLAARLGLPLIDLDDVIVAESGCSIPEIFQNQGEAEFRRRETETLSRVIGRPAILATGGGVVLSEENRSLLRSHPPVIWLKASPKFLAGRIKGDANRPLIAAGDTQKRLREQAAERDPLYEQCADLILRRDRMKKGKIVKVIVKFLSEWHETHAA